MVMTDDAICKQMLVHRTREYQIDVPKSNINEYNSPVFDILNTCKDFDILDICINMIENGFHFDKQEWKRKVCEIAWVQEDDEYRITCQNTFLFKVIDRSYILNWWILSDLIPDIISNCEVMSKLICNSSLLKDHDYRLKKQSFSHKICTQCMLGIREDTMHLVMQCPDTEHIKSEMFDVLSAIDDEHVSNVLQDQQNVYYVLLGKHPKGVPFDSMVKIWLVSSHYITRMYRRLLSKR